MTRNDRRPPVVFISYASEDHDTAHQVCDALEDRGFRCWIAPRDIQPGSEYGEAIIEAIRQTRLLVLVFSARADESPQVRREVERAASHDLTIITFRIEDRVPSKALEYFLSATHWLDAFPTLTDEHISLLVESVASRLAELIAVPGPKEQSDGKELPSRGRIRDRLRWVFDRRRLARAPVLLGIALPLLLLGALWTASIIKGSWKAPPAGQYGARAQEEFSQGRYDDAARTVDAWSQSDPGNLGIQALRDRLVRVQSGLRAFEQMVGQRSYDGAVDALRLIREANPSDPNQSIRWSILDNKFSPEFQDDFVGGLDYWDSPETWEAGSGKLQVRGPGIGWLRDRYYEDFEARFNLSFDNFRGAVWVVRGGDGDGYYFQLRGPRGSPPSSFAGYRVKEGRRIPLLGPIPVGGDLSLQDDQFNIIVRASGATIENSISIVSAPTEEPRVLGVVKDGTLARGRIGFGVRDNESFVVRALKIVPAGRVRP